MPLQPQTTSLKMNKGYVYCMACRDLPHLFKIGRTMNAYQRLCEANSHDTFKPPSGYYFLHLVRVADMVAAEAALHRAFANYRRKNPHGNASEFFQIDEASVNLEFASVDGDRVTVTTEVNKTAETRQLLRTAVKTQRPCSYLQFNPKHPGTKCHARYERYKAAVTVDEALKLGTFEDLVYDYVAGFFVFEAEIYDLSFLFP